MVVSNRHLCWKVTLQYRIRIILILMYMCIYIYIYLTSIHKQQHPKWVAGKSIKDNQITRSCLFLTSKHAKSMHMYIHYTYIRYTYGWITSIISPTELCRETTFPSKLIWPCYEIYWDYPPKGHWVFSPQLEKVWIHVLCWNPTNTNHTWFCASKNCFG